MTPFNIMDTLTPKPSFDPKRKNEAVPVVKPAFVNALHATSKIITGINRTKS